MKSKQAPMKETLLRGLVMAQVAETIANYARADGPLLLNFREMAAAPGPGGFSVIKDDETIWRALLNPKVTPWNSTWYFAEGVISEWVPRVPGLFWKPGSAAIRNAARAFIEKRSQTFLQYYPPGKSHKVAGGVGTLRLPPAQDGYRLVTLTQNLNASTGVPALIPPDTWDKLKLTEGAVVRGTASWRPMDVRWAEHFPAVRDIPRGYLVFGDLEVYGAVAPVEIHPFTVMEYWSDGAQLLDYVYATTDTSEHGYETQCKRFFESYRNEQGRAGTYLLSADIANPMWDAVYDSPAALRGRYEPQMHLLEARISGGDQANKIVEELLRVLSRAAGGVVLRRLSVDAGIALSWYGDGPIAELSSRLVAQAVKQGMLPALLQQSAIEFPKAFSVSS
jgi:hypothetical protein